MATTSTRLKSREPWRRIPTSPTSRWPVGRTPDYGESIVAVITPARGRDDHPGRCPGVLRGRLTGYKIPHDVITGAIPRNPSGTVLKHKLRGAVAQQQATAS